MKKTMKSLIKTMFVFILTITLTVILTSCDPLKQVISDVTESAVENQVNELLKDAGVENFELPEAKYYSGTISTEDDVTYYKVKVEEPAVTKEAYIEELSKMLGEEFDMTEFEGITEYTLEYEGTTYHFEFTEETTEENVLIWNLVVSTNNPVKDPTEEPVGDPE